mgnify:CR=1 FL=1
MIKNKNANIIYANRFISLIAEYGYTILINIYLSRISVRFVMYFWAVKLLASLVAAKVKNYLPQSNSRMVLFSIEAMKTILLIFLSFYFESPVLFLLVFLLELCHTLFSSKLYAMVPNLIASNNLIRFNSVYTSIGSLSYFLAPMIVGVNLTHHQHYLFVLYALLVLIGSIGLLFMHIQMNEDKKTKQAEKVRHNYQFMSIMRHPTAFLMMIGLLSSIGVLFDTYEVRYLIQGIGLSEQQYSFSLSFLAGCFLVTSVLLSFKKEFKSSKNVFLIGMFIYILYLILFSFAKSYFQVLFSYILLAVGQTIAGLVQNVYVQQSLPDEEIQNYMVWDEVLSRSILGAFVLAVGVFSPDVTALFVVFQSFSLVAMGMFLIFLLVSISLKKKP